MYGFWNSQPTFVSQFTTVSHNTATNSMHVLVQ